MPFDFDPETEFPRFFKDLEQGRQLICSHHLIEAAQERVAMRRYIRKHYPSLGVTARDMGTDELRQLVDDIAAIHGGI